MRPTRLAPVPRVASPRVSLSRGSRTCGRRRPSGLSIVLVVIALVVLIGFVSLAVDVGRVRVSKIQLQTAADAAATAAVSGIELFPQRGVLEPQERAYEAAAKNFALDRADDGGMRRDGPVELVVDEDVQFGRWNAVTREFTRLEQENGGIDERRQADAIRVWARRVTKFEDADGNVIERGTGVPLIFAPVLPGGPLNGEVQAKATAVLNGNVDAAGFVGLESVHFSGAFSSDSYRAGAESYPGADGPNRNTSIATNGDIRFTGATQIYGSVYPGINRWLLPQPLAGNIEITGHMIPLTKELLAVAPAFVVPTDPLPNQPETIHPLDAVGGGAFQPDNKPGGGNGGNGKGKNKRTSYTQTWLYSKPQAGGQSTHFSFTNWTTNSSDEVWIDNTDSPVEVWISGNFANIDSARIHLETNAHPVTFHVNGDMDIRGGGFVPPAAGSLPANLRILMSGANSTLRIGGAQPLAAHVEAPLSNINFSGNGTGTHHFFGRATGRSLLVASNVQLHYDESLGIIEPKYQIRLVE